MNLTIVPKYCNFIVKNEKEKITIIEHAGIKLNLGENKIEKLIKLASTST